MSPSRGADSIYLDNFAARERREIIDFFHERVDESRQVNWDQFFNHHIADRPERRARQKRGKIVLVFFILLNAAAFLALWLAGRGAQFAIYGTINLLVGIWCMWAKRSAPDRA